jgi:uncharacterized protein DUF3105
VAGSGSRRPKSGPTPKQAAAARASQRRPPAGRQRTVGLILAGMVAAVVVAAVVNSRSSGNRDSEKLQAVLTAGSCKADTKTDPGSSHVANPTFKVDPPGGGDHEPSAAQPGIYKPGQVPSDGQLVHAMEHGFIDLWYRPDAGTEVIEGLMALGDEFSNAVLVIPRPSLPVPVAATAWHRRLLCDGYEEEPLRAFIKAYTDKGPEKGFVE